MVYKHCIKQQKNASQVKLAGIENMLFLCLYNYLGNGVTDSTRRHHTNKARCHKAMVEIPFTYFSRTRYVEITGSNIRRVVWNEEVTIGRRHQTNQQCWV